MKLSTQSGTNLKGVTWGSMALFAPVIAGMPEGWERTGLISLFCVCMAVINWRTAGSGLTPEEGEELKDILLDPTADSIHAALKRGRQ